MGGGAHCDDDFSAAFSPSKVKRFGGRKALPPHQAVLLLKAQLDGGHEEPPVRLE